MAERLIPAIAFPPGEILQDELEERGLTQQDLVKISPDLPHKIDAVVKGKELITSDLAHELYQLLGISPEFWINLENNYRLYINNRLATLFKL